MRRASPLAVFAAVTACTSAPVATAPDPLSLPTVAAEGAMTAPAERDAARIGATLEPSQDFVRYAGRRRARTRDLGSPIRAAGEGEVSLSFVGAPLRDVVHEVLSEELGLSYVIADGVEGGVTWETTRPLPKADLLPTLRRVLAANGAALLSEGGLYRVIPDTDASGPVTFAGAQARGMSVRVLPLRHVKVDAVRDLVGAIAPEEGRVAFDTERDLVLILAGAEEQRAIVDVVSLVDTDVLAGASVALRTLERGSATGIADEAAAAMAALRGSEGALPGVRLMPITSLNAVMVVARSDALLDEALEWVNRLDAATGEGAGLVVYPVRNRRAAELAAVVGQLFALDGAASGADPLLPGAPQVALGEAAPPALASPGATTPPPAAYGNGQMRVVADILTNSLLISAEGADLRAVREAVERLDRLPVQVLIEATLLEVTLRDELSLGLRYFLQDRASSTAAFSDVAGGVDLESGAVAGSLPGLNYFLNTRDVSLVLTALREKTDVQFLSAPNMMVLDNQTARLQVGDEVPVQTRSVVDIVVPGAPIVNDIEYRQTGVILNVTPQVTGDGLVVLSITQEVSDVVQTSTSGIVSPTIQQRRFDSTVAVGSGETVILGGLTSRDVQLGRTAVPGLSRIPIVGNLFTSRTNSDDRTELVVLLTPRVLRDQTEVRRATEEVRQRLERAFDGPASALEQAVFPIRTIRERGEVKDQRERSSGAN